MAYKVFSNILQDHLWVIYGPEDMERLTDRGVSEGIYTAEEVRKLKGASREHLRAVHNVKAVFPASVVEAIDEQQ